MTINDIFFGLQEIPLGGRKIGGGTTSSLDLKKAKEQIFMAVQGLGNEDLLSKMEFLIISAVRVTLHNREDWFTWFILDSLYKEKTEPRRLQQRNSKILWGILSREMIYRGMSLKWVEEKLGPYDMGTYERNLEENKKRVESRRGVEKLRSVGAVTPEEAPEGMVLISGEEASKLVSRIRRGL